MMNPCPLCGNELNDASSNPNNVPVWVLDGHPEPGMGRYYCMMCVSKAICRAPSPEAEALADAIAKERAAEAAQYGNYANANSAGRHLEYAYEKSREETDDALAAYQAGKVKREGKEEVEALANAVEEYEKARGKDDPRALPTEESCAFDDLMQALSAYQASKKKKLSDRVRPNLSAAPWVVEAIKKLEAEIERLKEQR